MALVLEAYWGDPTAMFQLSQQLIANADGYIAALSAQSSQLVAPVINPNFPVVTTPPAPVSATMPALQQVAWTVPSQPAGFGGVLDLAGLTVGPFTGSAPTLSFGAAPASFTGAAPTSPSLNLNYTYPTPVISLPSAPALLTLDTVAFNPVSIPAFAADVPTLTAVAPAGFTYTEGGLFTSALLTQLQTNLQAALTDGSFTALTAQAQAAMFDAAREREYRHQADAIAELARMESLGYAFPPGAYLDARLKVVTETNNTLAGLSRDIMVKQAELQMENISKARDTATALEGKLIDYANQVAQRTFEAAKYAVEAAVAIYNTKVEGYKASLQAYTAQAQVYETQIKGVLATIEVTKAQVEFEKTKAEINTAIVAQYRAEVEASQAVLAIYKTQVDIIQTQAQVEKLKVDIFGAQIQAYVGEINAYTAGVEGYKASIQAQATIEEAYKTSVEAYSAQVNAGVAQINARVAAYRGQIDAYTAQLAGYDSSIKGMVGQAQAAATFNTAQAEVFKAQVASLSSYNDTLTKQWEAVLNEQEKIAQIGVAAAKANGDLYIAARGLSLDASKVGAQVASQLGAAALGAISWHSSTSNGYNLGISHTYDETKSVPTTSTVHQEIKEEIASA